jgi:hypothetical protein
VPDVSDQPLWQFDGRPFNKGLLRRAAENFRVFNLGAARPNWDKVKGAIRCAAAATAAHTTPVCAHTLV